MRRPLEDACRHGRRLLAAYAAVGLVAATAAGPSREYSSGSWGRSFFRPKEVQLDAVGLVNEDTVFLATRSGIKTLQRGHLTQFIEAVEGEDYKAFHLCHHRSSIFYQVLARDGGALSVYEYGLAARQKVLVHQFQDAVPATALACVDQWLLLASSTALLAVHLPTQTLSELRTFEDPEGADSIASVSVAYAADVVERAEVYVASPGNGTIVRLRLTDAGEGALREKASDVVLGAGEGSDGPVAEATVRSPGQLLWSRGQVLFTDGCALRSLKDGRVRTLLGGVGTCAPAANETLEPVPWATQLSRPRSLAAAAEGTAGSAVLLLTESQVLHVSEEANACAGAAATAPEAPGGAADACEADRVQCAWAEGPESNEALCLECGALERWLAMARPTTDVCGLEEEPRGGTRYSLGGCGCAPTPAPAPPTPGPDAAGDDATGLQAALSALLVIVLCVGGIVMHRRSRRQAALRDLYDVDTAEFHMFADNEGLH